MEMAADHAGQPGPDLGAVGTDDLLTVARDDEFDFEIGGESDFAAAEHGEETRNENGLDGDDAVAHGGEFYTHQDQDIETSVAQSHTEDVQDFADEDLGVELSAHDVMDDSANFGDVQDDTHSIGPEDNGEQLSEGVHDEMYPPDSAAELESHGSVAQLSNDQGDDAMNTATSVDVVQYEETNFPDDPAPEAGADRGEETNHSLPDDDSSTPQPTQGVQFMEELDETAADAEEDGHAQDETFVTAVEGDHGVDSPTESLGETQDSPDAAGSSPGLHNWEDTGDDIEHPSNARPSVTVSYRGQEYFLFAESSDEDPNTYFLDEADSVHRPLSEFLGNVRDVISDEIEAGDEVCVKIDGLGLEFGESTTKDFLEETTLAQIIQVNNKLVQHDGGSQSPELYMYLSIRSNPVRRFADLVKGVEGGQGLSHFEKYYDDPSADTSAAIEDDQFERDIVSEGDLSLGDAFDGAEEIIGDEDKSLENERQPQYLNPFRVETETEHEVLDIRAKIDAAVDHSDNDQEDNTMEAQQTFVDEALEGFASASAQADDEIAGDWDEDDSVKQQGEQNSAEEEVNGVDIQVVEDVPQAEVEQADDFTAAAVDEDYLDLGDSGSHDQIAADPVEGSSNGSMANLDAARQASHNSSATGTLDGDDSRYEDDTNTVQHDTDSSQAQLQPESGISQPDGDEIDWNHDDEDEIGAVDQNLTDSPSSLSGKRGRQEDEALDGLGDENAAKRRRV